FAAAARLQAEVGAAVPDQVELDVAAAAVELELALALVVLHGAATLDDGQPGVEEAVADRAHIGEVAFEVVGEVVEEQAADAARLIAVPEDEVVVAPFLVRVVARLAAEGLAQRARGAMPVQHVLVERIEGREVEAAAEPRGHGLAVALGAEMADVGV